MKVIASSTIEGFVEAWLLQGTDGKYTVLYGALGSLKTSNYDEASEYYKACVTKQLETI